MSSKVYLHIPCDGCAAISYSRFYTLANGLARQIKVREYNDMLLCQPCLDEYLNTTADGLRQMQMFDEVEGE